MTVGINKEGEMCWKDPEPTKAPADDGFNRDVLDALPTEAPSPPSFSALAQDSAEPMPDEVDLTDLLEQVEVLKNELAEEKERTRSLAEALRIADVRLNPDAIKDEGLRAHLFEALQRFFTALADVRADLERGSDYFAPKQLDALIESAPSAEMFLQSKSLEELRPMLEIYQQLIELGHMKRHYGEPSAREFVALAIVHRTAGVGPKKAEK